MPENVKNHQHFPENVNTMMIFWKQLSLEYDETFTVHFTHPQQSNQTRKQLCN